MTIKTSCRRVLATLVFSSPVRRRWRRQRLQAERHRAPTTPTVSRSQDASGVRYRQGGLTSAHKTLPLGTKVRVTNLKSGESVDVEINDRGPHVKGRVVDLSKAAARELGMTGAGLVKVQVEVIEAANDA